MWRFVHCSLGGSHTNVHIMCIAITRWGNSRVHFLCPKTKWKAVASWFEQFGQHIIEMKLPLFQAFQFSAYLQNTCKFYYLVTATSNYVNSYSLTASRTASHFQTIKWIFKCNGKLIPTWWKCCSYLWVFTEGAVLAFKYSAVHSAWYLAHAGPFTIIIT